MLAASLPLLLVTLVPLAILYAGNVVFADASGRLRPGHLGDIARILAGGVIVALFFGLVGLAVASLTGRRAFAIGGYLAFMIVPTIVGGVLAEDVERRRRPAADGVRGRSRSTWPSALYPGYTDRGDPSSASAWALT